MDSGAWSAYQAGGTVIDVARYADFLHANASWIAHYINLDVIAPGNTEAAAAQGFANWQYLRSRGLEPMAVFHQGEDIRWLHKYLDAGCTYLGLAGLSLPQRQKRFEWYRLVWPYLVNGDGLPIIRVHALGDTFEDSLSAFPWYSCDSSSWFYISYRLGQFRLDGGQTIGFGNKSKSSARADIRDFADPASATALLRKYGIRPDVFEDRTVTARVHPDNDTDRRIISRMLAARGWLTLMSYKEMERRLQARVPVRFFGGGGLVNKVTPSSAPAWPDYNSFMMYLVTGGSGNQLPLLYRASHEPVLASYWYFLDNDRGDRAYEVTKWFVEDPARMIYDQSAGTRSVAEGLDEILAEHRGG